VTEAAAGDLADGHLDVAAEQDGQHHAASQARVGVHEFGEQGDERSGAFGVPDEDDRAAVVIVGQVVLKGGLDAAVRDADTARARARALVVERRPHPAYLGEPSRLLGDGGSQD
jgi:hypothetical protein